jgi:hypothetical protein
MKMPEDITEITAANLLPDATFGDNFYKFVEERCHILNFEASKLLRVLPTAKKAPMPHTFVYEKDGQLKAVTVVK